MIKKILSLFEKKDKEKAKNYKQLVILTNLYNKIKNENKAD